MRKYNTKLRSLYYDEVVRLYTQEGMGRDRISRVVPVNERTISRWIRIFASENKANETIMKEKPRTNPIQQATPEPVDVKILQDEIARLKKQLAYESMKSAAFNEMINVAEKQFNISIRKKAGTKQ